MLTAWNGLATSWGSRFLRGSATTLATDTAGSDFVPTPDRYTLAELYYANAMYERADASNAAIKAWAGLPRNIRPVLSLAKPACDWWSATLFGGVWTADGLPASDGQPNLLQYDADVPEDIRLAVQTAFTWGNGAAEIPAWCRMLAILGDGFAEIEVDQEREKAYPKFWHPRYVTDITWNGSGDVIEYTLEIPRKEGNTAYKWGKTVTKETITFLKDGKPFDYGEGQTIPNPFRFVPAVWVQHVNVGGQHGAGVMDALYPVIDEVCGAVGASIDFIHRFVKQHVLIETTDPGGLKTTTQNQTKRGSTHDFADPNADRESQTVRPAPPGTKVHRIIENLGLAEADPHIQRLLANIEKNVPELTIDEKLAESRQVSFPGAVAIAAPMQRRVNHVFGNEGNALAKLGQMACTINGAYLNSGAWGRGGTTEAQQRFRPFNLATFDNPGIPVSFVTPRLIEPSLDEKVADIAAIERLQSVWGLRRAGLSDGDLYGRDASGNEVEAPAGGDPGLIAEREQRRQEQEAAAVGLFNRGGGI